MAHKSRWPQLAAESGVPYHTLRKVGAGTTKQPRLYTIEKLIRTLEKWDQPQ